MCFSATASFTASGILLIAGLASVSQVTKPSQLVFASTPLVFSLQQFSEGALWQSIGQADLKTYQQIFTYVFVFFGQVIWPLWVPIADMLLEQDQRRKKIMRFIVLLGMIISGVLIFQMFQHKVSASLDHHHIHYDFDYSKELFDRFNLTYLIPTVLVHFISSNKKINTLGLLTLASFFISKIFYFSFVFSVWCFFSAILSLSIFLIMRSLKKDTEVIGSSIRFFKD